MMRHRIGILVVAFVAVFATSARAYLRLGQATVSGKVVAIQWPTTITYFVSNVNVPQVTATDLAAAVDKAFKTWSAVNGVSIASRFGGFTDALPGTGDAMTVIGFEDREEPDFDDVLGQTTFGIDRTTGVPIEADIVLNARFLWSVAAAGEPDRYDAQSIATHEVGHLLGLGHSAIGETQDSPVGRSVIAKAAVMFPLAFPAGNVLGRTLDQDDRAGIQAIYGSSSLMKQLGSIAGRVTLNGKGLFGAHVTATNVATGGLTGGFTLDDSGSFVISSLQPGLYLLRAEPLDDVDVGSIFDSGTVVNVNFRQTFYSRLVSVPRGGAGASFEFPVQAK
jgi:hypothetical protein